MIISGLFTRHEEKGKRWTGQMHQVVRQYDDRVIRTVAAGKKL